MGAHRALAAARQTHPHHLTRLRGRLEKDRGAIPRHTRQSGGPDLSRHVLSSSVLRIGGIVRGLRARVRGLLGSPPPKRPNAACLGASATSTDHTKTAVTHPTTVIRVMARYGRSRAAGPDNSAPAQLLEVASTSASKRPDRGNSKKAGHLGRATARFGPSCRQRPIPRNSVANWRGPYEHSGITGDSACRGGFAGTPEARR